MIVKMKKKSSGYKGIIKNHFFLILQRLWISFELFNKNGLMNHAAACAYGFLLSAAPALLFIAFFISRALAASPELMESLLEQIGFLLSTFHIQDLMDNFLHTANSGLAGLISIITIFWTSRLCALSAQRGLGVVFPGSRSVLKSSLVTIAFCFCVILFIFIILMGLRIALNLYNSPNFSFTRSATLIFFHFTRIIFLFIFALLTLAAYRFVPAYPPKIKNILPGVITCLVFFLLFTALFSQIINPERYNLLYGTLGRLFLFLVNIYFFFVFFFFGAQLIQVLGISEALLFARFRQVHSKQVPLASFTARLFADLPLLLQKYFEFYKQGDSVFTQHSQGKEVYYILSGKAGVYLDPECLSRIALIDEGHFFGEMAGFDTDGRAASIKAETDLEVLVMPPNLFATILQIDPDTDQNLIITLSERLKLVNQQITKS